jgi:hypothetical protein
MFTFLLFLGWLFLLIYGVVLLGSSKYRKFGITLTTVLLAPLALIVSLGLYMDFEKFDCYSNAPDQSKCTLENNWKY